MKKFLIITGLVASSLIGCSPAMANDTLGIIAGGWSWHSMSGDYNENNKAFGLEYNNVAISTMKNSYNKRSYLGYYTYKFYDTEWLDVGIRLGASTGYEDTPVGMAIVPIVSPVVSFKYVELGLLPMTDGVVGTLNLKYEFNL